MGLFALPLVKELKAVPRCQPIINKNIFTMLTVQVYKIRINTESTPTKQQFTGCKRMLNRPFWSYYSIMVNLWKDPQHLSSKSQVF